MNDDFFSLISPPIEIPDYWTPEIACEVVNFLSDIIQVIWANHGTAMARYLERPLPPDKPPLHPDDDLLF